MNAIASFLLLSAVCTGLLTSADRYHPDDDHEVVKNDATANEDKDYWTSLGLDDIKKSLDKFDSLNTNLAKNVIIFIGDGMSLPTVSAGRIYKAQMNNNASDGVNVNGFATKVAEQALSIL